MFESQNSKKIIDKLKKRVRDLFLPRADTRLSCACSDYSAWH